MKIDREKDIRVFLGKGGKGKSWLVRHQLKSVKRMILFDPNGEPENAALGAVCRTPAELLECLDSSGKPFRVIWRGFETMGKAAYEYGNQAALAAGNLVLVWEECDRFIGPHILPEYADRIINAGRHEGIRVWGIARRANKVPRDLTANASRIVIFGTNEPADLKYAKEYIGDAWAEKLPGLPRFSAIDFTEAKTSIKKSPF